MSKAPVSQAHSLIIDLGSPERSRNIWTASLSLATPPGRAYLFSSESVRKSITPRKNS
jgi:hypothetical protein